MDEKRISDDDSNRAKLLKLKSPHRISKLRGSRLKSYSCEENYTKSTIHNSFDDLLTDHSISCPTSIVEPTGRHGSKALNSVYNLMKSNSISVHQKSESSCTLRRTNLSITQSLDEMTSITQSKFCPDDYKNLEVELSSSQEKPIPQQEHVIEITSNISKEENLMDNSSNLNPTISEKICLSSNECLSKDKENIETNDETLSGNISESSPDLSFNSNENEDYMIESIAEKDENETTETIQNVRKMSNHIRDHALMRKVTTVSEKKSTDSIETIQASITAFKESLNLDSHLNADLSSVSEIEPDISIQTQRNILIDKFIKEEAIFNEILHHLNAMDLACTLNQQSSASMMSQADIKKLFSGIKELFQFYDGAFNSFRQNLNVGQYLCGQYFTEMTKHLVHFMSRSEADDCIDEIMKKYENIQLFRMTIARPIKVIGCSDYILTNDALRRPSQRLLECIYFLNNLKHLPSENEVENQQISDAIEIFQIYMDVFSKGHHKISKHLFNRQVLSFYNSVQLVDGEKLLRMIFIFTDMVVCAAYNKKGDIVIKWNYSYSQISHEDLRIENTDELIVAEHLEALQLHIHTLKADLEIQKLKILSNKKTQNSNKLLKAIEEEELNYLLESFAFKIELSICNDNKKKISLLFLNKLDSEEIYRTIKIRSACRFIPIIHPNSNELLSIISKTVQNSYELSDSSKNNDTSVVSDNEFCGYLSINLCSTYRLSFSSDAYIKLHLNHSPEKFVCKVKIKTAKGSDPISHTEIAFFKRTTKLMFSVHTKNDTLIFQKIVDFDLEYLKNKRLSRFFFENDLGHFVVFCRFAQDCKLSSFDSSDFFDGPSLSDVARYEMKLIPSIVTLCCEYIIENGKTTQGVYRMSPSKKELDELFESYKKGLLFDKRQLSVLDIHLIAVLLKTFLRNLSVPFVSEDMKKSLEAWFEQSPNDKGKLKSILNSLEEVNYNCLFYIYQHIFEFSQFKASTMMSDISILKIFNAAIFREHTVTFCKGIFDSYISDPKFFWKGLS